jgi:hypothetical protein
MIPLPFLVASTVAAFVIGAGAGVKITADHYQAAAARSQQEAAGAYQARTVELNDIAAQLEQSRHERKTVYRTITREVDKVVSRDVYRNVCLDSDGVRLVNDALAGRASAGQPADAVPAAGAAAGGNGR